MFEFFAQNPESGIRNIPDDSHQNHEFFASFSIRPPKTFQHGQCCSLATNPIISVNYMKTLRVYVFMATINDIITGFSKLELRELKTVDEMNHHFSLDEYWCYSEPTTLSDSFGSFREFDRVGRESQLIEVWKRITKSNPTRKDRNEVLYFHGSPGLGKTHLLREIFSKKDGDYPLELKDKVTALRILVLDFNRSACIDACAFREYLHGHENLFALSRLYYVTFARQDNLSWEDFLAVAVVSLIRSGCYVSLKQLIVQKIRDITKEGRCAI